LIGLDVFRGSTIAGMILVNSQASPEDAYQPFVHAPWHGLRFADTIFPAFLFIVGVSLALSIAARVRRGESPGGLIAHAARRSALLFAAGVFIDALQFPYGTFPFFTFEHHLHLAGVLQKIALCYFVAFLVYLHGGIRGAIVAIFVLNLVYLALLFYYPVPGCGPSLLTTACNFPGYLDRIVLDGFTWDDSTRQDPDGLGTLLPSISSVLFGVVAAQVLQSASQPHRRVLRLLGGGVGLIAAGAALATWIPVNKPLWTTSYAVLTAGLAAVGLAVWLCVVEAKPGRRWFKPLEILGLNPFVAYMISRPVTNVIKGHFGGMSLYTDVLRRVASPPAASILFATAALLTVFCLVWLMHLKGWHLRA
jgi:predicted acyltransferase